MNDDPVKGHAGERLAKVIARSGMCSRRDAEDWIRAGRVSVNGTVIRTPAYNVSERDSIRVDGQPLAARSGTRVWLYHKPPGLVVTEKDPEGRPTIFESLAEKGLPRVLTVGRLDLNTEGLLLLTNDGGLKRVLELPATGWLRRYRVRAFGRVTQAQLDGMKDGVEVDGVKYGPIEAQLERQQGSNVWLVVGLREGKNREVKNVLASIGLQVNRLIRVSYGPFQLGDLPVGGVEVVRSRVLREQLGRKLADAAGADFESELPEASAPREVRRAPAGARRHPGRPDERARSDERGRGPAPSPTGRPRRIFFDDGRPPEEYQEKPQRRGRDDDTQARGARPLASGRPPARGARADRPPRDDGGKPGPRPSRGDGPKRGGPHPDRERSADRPSRPPRSGDEARTGRPASRGRPGADSRPPRSPGAKPARPGGPSRAPRSGGPGKPTRPGGAGKPTRPGGRPPRKPRS